jgi:hypothetical protein
MTIPIHRWTGEYIGFLDGDWLYDTEGSYLGWREEPGAMWFRDGVYLGQVVENHYVLRDVRWAQPVRRAPPVSPLPCAPPPRPGSRSPRIPRPNWTDGLAALGLRATASDLAGEWMRDKVLFRLREGGGYEIRTGSETHERGAWRLAGTLLVLRPESGEGVSYRVVDYLGHELTLRQQVMEGRSLPLTLSRRRR